VTVSDVHRGVVDTHAIVSDIHQKMLKSQEGANGNRQSVSATLTVSIAE